MHVISYLLAALPTAAAYSLNTGGEAEPDDTWGQDVITPTGGGLRRDLQGFVSRILYAPSQPDLPAFRATIAAITGGTVDYIDARASTPDATTLLTYDCVFTWAKYQYFNKVLFGDRLADFVDADGRVVLGSFAAFTNGNFLGGRIMTTSYCPVVGGSNWYSTSSYAGDGTTQIHNGVTSYSAFYRDILATQGTGLQDGSYVDGEIAQAYRPDFKVIYSNGANGLPGHFAPDWPLVIANACSADVDTDGDGVFDEDDFCPEGTIIPESVPRKRLGVNRWALANEDDAFATTNPKGVGPQKSYTLLDTHGCSCEQIIHVCNYGKGHTKFGCSISVMEAFKMTPPRCDGLTLAPSPSARRRHRHLQALR